MELVNQHTSYAELVGKARQMNIQFIGANRELLTNWINDYILNGKPDEEKKQEQLKELVRNKIKDAISISYSKYSHGDFKKHVDHALNILSNFNTYETLSNMGKGDLIKLFEEYQIVKNIEIKREKYFTSILPFDINYLLD